MKLFAAKLANKSPGGSLQEHGRKLDKLVWERGDFGGDGVHPIDSGRMKVTNLLLNFLTTDPLAKP